MTELPEVKLVKLIVSVTDVIAATISWLESVYKPVVTAPLKVTVLPDVLADEFRANVN